MPNKTIVLPADHPWESRYLRLARELASWSKDPSTKVGAVIVREDKTIVSMGFNGFPRGVSDNHDLYKDRETKLHRIVHAEINAIITARQNLQGCTLYVWPCQPCSHCMAAIIQAGITRIVTVRPHASVYERWEGSFNQGAQMAHEAAVKLIIHHASNLDMRDDHAPDI